MNKGGIGGTLTLRAFIKSLLQLFATLKCLRTDLVCCCSSVMLHRSYSCNKYFINWVVVWHTIYRWLFLWCKLLKCKVFLLYFVFYDSKLDTAAFQTMSVVRVYLVETFGFQPQSVPVAWRQKTKNLWQNDDWCFYTFHYTACLYKY